MTPDLTLLVWSVALAFVQIMVAAGGNTRQVGLAPLAGNREGLPAPTGWAGRAKRAAANMLETLPLFAILVLTAHVGGRVTPMVVIGAQLYFWARLIYLPVYAAGIPYLRTLVWTVSIIGIVLLLVALF